VKLPASLAEVGSEGFRPKLQAGIYSGYATVAALLVFALVAHRYGLVSRVDWALALVATKFITNTLAWIALTKRRLVIGMSALNIFADVMVMTGAVYFTGAAFSPLVSLYFVEVAVMALLTNVGLTVATILGALGLYVTMVALVVGGVLPQTTSIVPAHPSPVHVTVFVVYVAGVLIAPGAYIAAIVQRLREKERALAARNKELVDASRVKSEFTANITHELRTPLHGILGMGELVEDEIYGPITDKQRAAIKNIRSSAGGLLELIDSLLVVARDEARALELRKSNVDLVEVVESVATTARMLVGSRDLAVTVEINDRESPLENRQARIETDRPKLVQILVNLVANAVKFTEDGGRVTLVLRSAPSLFELRVEDTGRGIGRESIDRVFEPYVQIDRESIGAHGGSGLGLSVVRTLAKLLSMRISVDSELGRGSVFTLQIDR
jgi:signal transduction histidine kinase